MASPLLSSVPLITMGAHSGFRLFIFTSVLYTGTNVLLSPWEHTCDHISLCWMKAAHNSSGWSDLMLAIADGVWCTCCR